MGVGVGEWNKGLFMWSTGSLVTKSPNNLVQIRKHPTLPLQPSGLPRVKTGMQILLDTGLRLVVGKSSKE